MASDIWQLERRSVPSPLSRFNIVTSYTPRLARLHTRRRRANCLTVLLILLAPATLIAQAPTPAPTQAPTAAPAAAPGPRGFVVGQIVDRESGRPLSAANIVLVGTTLRTQTDLDGRFRLPAPAGTYSARAFRLGNAPSQIDSVRVVAGATVTANFALGGVAVQLSSVAVTAGPVRATSEDALLAMQRSAPRVSDGISAQAIARAPGSSASDAIVRVTGVAIVDNKFAIVRGLAERYSNTLLNGVELPSPEPLKKIVPLDLFPSSLLESIVVSKTATPDRPGDFAGGSVEVTTKEFPDQRVAEGSASFGWNSQSTFRDVPHVAQRGIDWLGFDAGGRRQMPSPLPTQADGSVAFNPRSEQFAERLRNVWAPALTPIEPNLGLAANFGGRVGGDGAPFGYAVSATLNRQVEATPNRLAQLVFDENTGIPDQGYVSSESATSVDLGAIANFAMRLGPTQKLGWKNIYTRNTDERLARRTGFETYNGNVERLIYQSTYVARSLFQTQLTGDHLIAPVFGSRLEWKATLAFSSRDEPENRSLIYFRDPAQTVFELAASKPSPFWFRFLDDQTRSAQVDWSVPVGFLPDGTQFKTGWLYRERRRTFNGFFFRAVPSIDPLMRPFLQLRPEEALGPEALGAAVDLRRESVFTVPYESNDDVRAAYAMGDLPITSWLRVIAGVRTEDWRLTLYNGTRRAPILEPTRRRNVDMLPSVNVTISLSDRQNLRLAAYQTVARPDAREVSPDQFVAVTGDCGNQGNPNLRRARILNGDLRWEYYPAAGELISVSLFGKNFTDAIGEILAYTGSSNCDVLYTNFEAAMVAGGEFEFRKALTFLPGPLARLGLGMNLTLVRSSATVRVDSALAITYKLQGQSDQLANLNVNYTDDARGLDASMVLNYFSDRIVRYGIASISTSSTGENTILQVPGVIEQGRVSLDAKLRKRVGRRTISLSARNLTDNEVIFYQAWDGGRTRTGYLRPGVSVSLGVGYAIR